MSVAHFRFLILKSLLQGIYSEHKILINIFEPLLYIGKKL